MNSSLRLLVSSIILILGGIAVALKLNSQPKPADRTYVGQQSCMAANCHEDAYGANSDYKGAEPFRQTMHQKIHLRPTPETVVIDRLFEKDTTLTTYWFKIRAEGKDTLKIRLFKSDDRKDYMVQMYFSGGSDSIPPLKVAYTYGGNGWIQRYLLEVDGRYYPTPFQYVLPGYRDRSGFGGDFYYLDIERYWAALDPNTFEGKFYEWNTTTFRNLSWDRNCAACHLNGFDLKTELIDGENVTRATWVGRETADSALRDQNILIGCESCHGPGSEHVANPTVDNIVAPNSQAQFPRTFAGTELKMDLCNQCHDRFRSAGDVYNYAYDDAAKKPFMPGEPLALYQLDSITGMNKWPNGNSYAHHQTGQDFKRSKPYLQHVFKNGCWSCHTVHHDKEGLPYQLDRDWYTLQKGKGCVAYGCHEAKADVGYSPIVEDTVNLHTLHSAEVSQCVNCHFTKTASIGFVEIPGKKPLYEFSSHDFKVIRPTATNIYRNGAIGMMNTCAASCHRNGRGARNFSDSTPVAPDYGITDPELGFWKNKEDFALADSLWFHYKRLWPAYTQGSGVKVSGDAEGSRSAITMALPNPFTSLTTIRYTVAVAGELSLEVYDMKGRLVRVLAAGRFERGTYAQTWDGTDELGAPSGIGTYVVRLKSIDGTSSSKLVLVR